MLASKKRHSLLIASKTFSLFSQLQSVASKTPSDSHCMSWKRDGAVLTIVTALAVALRVYMIWCVSDSK